MSRRKRDEPDDDAVRVHDPQGRRIRGRTEWERAALEEARRLRKAGLPVGQVVPPPVTAALDREQVGGRLQLSVRRRSLPAVDESDDVRHFCFERGAYFTWCCWHLIAEPPDVRYDKVIGENDEVVYDTQLCTCPGLEHRREEERQALERARQEGWGHWRTEAMWREIRAHVNRTVAKAPPLTEDQRSRLAVLLRPS